MAVAAPPSQSVPPNQSLYIQNLPEKLQKDDLRRELYMLFSTYGPVIDVTAMKTKKMRGQAHVLFKDVHSATQAMRSCRGFEFFGRSMVISYSKNRSNTLSKLTGTFNPPTQNTSATSTAAQSTLLSQPPTSFPAPPGSSIPPPGSLAQPPQGLPAAPPGGLPPPPAALPGPPTSLPPPPKANGTLKAPEEQMEDVASPQGVKRAREESDEEGSEDEGDEAPMEEDDEDEEGGEMEMSDED